MKAMLRDHAKLVTAVRGMLICFRFNLVELRTLEFSVHGKITITAFPVSPHPPCLLHRVSCNT